MAPKKSFWFPLLLVWAAVPAIVLQVIHQTQCPANNNGYQYMIYSCGSLKPAYLSLWAFCLLQVLVALVANYLVSTENDENGSFMVMFFFLKRVNNPLGQARFRAQLLWESEDVEEMTEKKQQEEVDSCDSESQVSGPDLEKQKLIKV